jgi:hypothetical protein
MYYILSSKDFLSAALLSLSSVFNLGEVVVFNVSTLVEEFGSLVTLLNGNFGREPIKKKTH